MSRRIAVISVNDNPEYLFYLPVVAQGWHKLGYDVHCFLINGADISLCKKYYNPLIYGGRISFAILDAVKSIDEITYTQCMRLFAAYNDNLNPEDRLITSDIDMLVCKDIFQDQGTIDTYGRDLTDRQYPMCYISMTAEKWREVMGIDMNESLEANMERIIKAEPWHNSTLDWQRWCTDQEIITKKLETVKGFVYHHDRGVDPVTGYPTGRLDRAGWKQPQGEIIDVHLPRNPLQNYDKIAPLCGDWFPEYFNEFKKLYGPT